jgi:hypothetical protein
MKAPHVALLALTAATAIARDANACSCMDPPPVLLTPDRNDDAPLNTRVRVEVPFSKDVPDVVLRVHKGDVVPATKRAVKGDWVAFVEVVPKKPLDPKTRYEIGYVDPMRHPSTIVFGTFTTGIASDTTAPRIETFGGAIAHKDTMRTNSCSVSNPRVVIDGLASSDPGRAGAQIAWSVWRADANGVVDDTKPPAATLLEQNGAITLGRTSSCDPRSFDLPEKGVVTLGIAAVDEAGNKSATRKVRVDLGAAVP